MLSPSRPDPERLARLPFGADWLALGPPSEDPMDVRTRMAMYRLLVERSSPHCGEHDEQSPFWGYASQLAWQQRSGRLGRGQVIDATSWWGACNYALSVIPYVAAMQLGMVPTLALHAEPAYATAVPPWRAALEALADGGDFDAIRLAVWRAHLHAITLAVDRHRPLLARLPAAEQRFARGWVRMVDLFAAAALRTDLDSLVKSGGGSLPSRVLTSRDVSDLPAREARNVRRVGALADRPALRWRLELAAWRRIMRTPHARAEAEPLLAGLLGAGHDVRRQRLRALRYLVAR